MEFLCGIPECAASTCADSSQSQRNHKLVVVPLATILFTWVRHGQPAPSCVLLVKSYRTVRREQNGTGLPGMEESQLYVYTYGYMESSTEAGWCILADWVDLFA